MLFCRNLNQIHSNVKFTDELVSNKQLPLLHVNVAIQKKN